MKYRDKFILITFAIIFLTYNFIGYFLDVEMLKVVIFNDDKGINVSFVALIFPMILSYIIYYCTGKLKKV